jgi:hypothetical protein
MNDELEGIWIEAVVECFRAPVILQHYLILLHYFITY